jgi:hypothetical protein
VAFNVLSGAFVAVIVATGVLCALVELGWWGLTRRGPLRNRLLVLGPGGLLLGVVMLLALWGTANFLWNTCDDDVSYLYLAQRLVLRGDLLDPLNNRRLTSLGGMSALQALFLFRLPDAFLPLADLLIGALLILVGLWRTCSGRWSGWGIAAALTVIVFPLNLGLGNTSPVLLPVGIAIAAFLSAIRLRAQAVTTRAELVRACILGLLVGAAVTLRPQFGFPLGLFALIAVSWPPLSKGLVYRLVGWAVGLIAAIAGWSVASWRAVATPIFPIFTGNLDPTWPALGPPVHVPSAWALLGRVAEALISPPWGLAVLGGICVAAYILKRSSDEPILSHWDFRLLLVAIGAGIVWIVVLADMWWGLGPPLARFWAPVLMACLLLPIGVINGSHGRRTRLNFVGGLVMLGLVVGVTAASPGLAASHARTVAEDTKSGRVKQMLSIDRYAVQRDEYTRAAALIPPGSKVLAAVDVPSLLMASGIDVNTLDLVGSTSPSPHLPYFRGTAAKLMWLRAHGYEFVIAVDPNSSACLYNRSLEEEDIRGKHGQQFQAWARYYFDWVQFLKDASITQGSTRIGSLVVLNV